MRKPPAFPPGRKSASYSRLIFQRRPCNTLLDEAGSKIGVDQSTLGALDRLT
jgi:hypothetical protein